MRADAAAMEFNVSGLASNRSELLSRARARCRRRRGRRSPRSRSRGPRRWRAGGRRGVRKRHEDRRRAGRRELGHRGRAGATDRELGGGVGAAHVVDELAHVGGEPELPVSRPRLVDAGGSRLMENSLGQGRVTGRRSSPSAATTARLMLTAPALPPKTSRASRVRSRVAKPSSISARTGFPVQRARPAGSRAPVSAKLVQTTAAKRASVGWRSPARGSARAARPECARSSRRSPPRSTRSRRARPPRRFVVAELAARAHDSARPSATARAPCRATPRPRTPVERLRDEIVAAARNDARSRCRARRRRRRSLRPHRCGARRRRRPVRGTGGRRCRRPRTRCARPALSHLARERHEHRRPSASDGDHRGAAVAEERQRRGPWSAASRARRPC